MKRGAIFDMDGTLFDTEKLYRQAWIETADTFGVERKPEIAALMSGGTVDRFFKVLSQYFPTVDGREYVKRVFQRVVDGYRLQGFGETGYRLDRAQTDPVEVDRQHRRRHGGAGEEEPEERRSQAALVQDEQHDDEHHGDAEEAVHDEVEGLNRGVGRLDRLPRLGGAGLSHRVQRLSHRQAVAVTGVYQPLIDYVVYRLGQPLDRDRADDAGAAVL